VPDYRFRLDAGVSTCSSQALASDEERASIVTRPLLLLLVQDERGNRAMRALVCLQGCGRRLGVRREASLHSARV